MTILVALDDSEPAREALEYAASTYSDSEIVALHVVNPVANRYLRDPASNYADYERILEEAETNAEELFEEANEIAEAHGASLTTETVLGRPASTIVDYLEEAEDVDHVVIGSHGRSGAARILLGSVAERVVRRSPAPVTVIR